MLWPLNRKVLDAVITTLGGVVSAAVTAVLMLKDELLIRVEPPLTDASTLLPIAGRFAPDSISLAVSAPGVPVKLAFGLNRMVALLGR